MTDLALRPRSSTEIIDLAVRLVRRHFGAMFAVALVGLVPSLVLQVLFLTTIMRDPTVGGFSRVGWIAVASWPVLLVALVAMLGSLYAAADQGLRTGNVDVRAAVGRGVRRLGVTLGVLILSSLAIGVGFLLLLVPGIYVSLRLATALPAAATEDRGVVETLRRAWARGDGMLIHTFVTMLLMGLVAIVVLIMGAVIGGVVSFAAAGRAGTLVVTQVINTLATAAVYPLLTSTLLVLAYDLRVRREAYDVEAMAGALGGVG